MDSRRARRVGFTLAFLALALGGLFAAGTIAAPAAAPAASRGDTGGALTLRFNLKRFQVVRHGKRLVAHGNVVATYRDQNGVQLGKNVQAITLRAQQGSTCEVLHLELGQLHLELLGLIVDLTAVDSDKIVLDISGKSDEALGKILCQLIGAIQSGKATKATKATRRLNAAMAKRNHGSVMTLSVPLGQRQLQQAAAATGPGPCKVLDLVLGPLYVDLLGLVIQLNKVELQITAEPVGTLGTLFCQLSGGPSTTSSTASTTTTGATTTTTPASTTTTTTATTTTG
jgi:hypothetical protein